jgi:hypothetical protein
MIQAFRLPVVCLPHLSRTVMEHRYGRHGPRAWLRMRQRRYGRPSRLPVPVEPQPTIIHVHVPINAERIIFIIMTGESDTNAASGQPPAGLLGEAGQQFYRSTDGLQPPLLPQDKEQEKLANLQHLSYFASTDADRKARRDLARLDDIADDDELRAYAQRLWDSYGYDREAAIREEAVAAGMKGYELLPLYQSEFIAVYRSRTKVAPPDSRMKTIQKQAHADKKWDTEHEVSLYDDERMRQAAIRVSERIGLDPQTDRQEITRLVRAYESSYQQYDPAQVEMEEEDRSPRSRGF